MSNLEGFRARLHQPGPLYWAILVIPEPAVASVVGFSGVDWVMIDAEHGPFTLTSLRPYVEALKNTPANIVVRTASPEQREIQHYLDLGVDGVLVPHIESAEAAESVVRAVRFPPEGSRGISEGTRATRFGLDEDEYLARANDRVAAMVLIESKLGAENAAEIAAVSGLDAIIIGPGDLSADMGIALQYSHPELRAAINQVVDAVLPRGIKIATWREPESQAEFDSGLVHAFTDAVVLTSAAKDSLTDARAWGGNFRSETMGA